MSKISEFELRRRERRRREKLRKKRIRAAVLLILLIVIIILICSVISSISKNNDTLQNPDSDITIETTAMPTTAPAQTAALNIPSPEEETNLLQIIADAGQKKHCYLTFDDGPTENITPQILDVLRRYNVKATFFQVGSLIESSPDMARRVYEEGHLLANHSYGHNYEKLYASTDAFMTEIKNCENAIRSVMDGEEPFKLMRFPGGSYNSGDHGSIKQQCKTVLEENDYYYIDWNSLNGDAEGKTKNADELLAYLKNSVEGYNNLIILMHDASTKQATVDALGPTIEYLTSKGYTFHRLDDIDYHANKASSTSAPSTSSSESSSSSSASATKAPAASPASSKAPATSEPTSEPEDSGKDSEKDKDNSEDDKDKESEEQVQSTPTAGGAIIIQ